MWAYLQNTKKTPKHVQYQEKDSKKRRSLNDNMMTRFRLVAEFKRNRVESNPKLTNLSNNYELRSIVVDEGRIHVELI